MLCAGLLYSIYIGQSVEEALKIACATAACSLSEVDSTTGIKNIEEIIKLYEKYNAC